MIRKKIKIDVFSRTLELIVTRDLAKEFRTIAKRHKIEVDMDTNIEGCYIPGRSGMHYVIVHSDCLSYNTISHELYHAAHGILERLCIEDEETKAWLCGYLSANVYGHLAKKKMKIKNG